MGATTAIVLDSRSKNRLGKSPIKLRVIHDRVSRMYSTGYFADDNEFEKITNPNSRGEHRTTRLKLNDIEAKANTIINNLTHFNFDLFKSKFTNPGSSQRDIYSLFKEYINDLLKSKRIGTANSYKDAMNSFKKFKKRLMIEDVTKEFLQKYEDYMYAQGRSTNTVGIYCRSLRTIFNNAIHNGLISKENYPFGKREYSIPGSINNKRALDLSNIQLIFDFIPQTKGQQLAKDLFIMSYLCNGMNLSDILRLRIKDVNLEEGVISFIRQKTKETNKIKQKKIEVDLNVHISQIIDRWKAQSKRTDDHLLKILENRLPADLENKRIKNINSNINRRLKLIAKKLGIPSFSMYAARHSYATILKRSGAPVQFISESLGHNSIKTTEIYLGSFEKESRKKWNEKLTTFIEDERPSQRILSKGN